MYGPQPDVSMNALSGLLSAFIPQRPGVDIPSQVTALIQNLVEGNGTTEQHEEAAMGYEAEDLGAIRTTGDK